MTEKATLDRPCKYCGGPVEGNPKWDTKKYCSDTCRHYASMQRKFGGGQNNAK